MAQTTFQSAVMALFLLLRLPTLSLAQAGFKMPNQTNGNNIPLIIENNCPDTIWPAVLTQFGVGPGTGGFELPPAGAWGGWLSYDFQGRVWGRTNCSFNDNGTGPSVPGGARGDGRACFTGDCGVLNCVGAVCIRFLAMKYLLVPLASLTWISL
jgi:hypothetical protein